MTWCPYLEGENALAVTFGPKPITRPLARKASSWVAGLVAMIVSFPPCSPSCSSIMLFGRTGLLEKKTGRG